MMNQRNKKIISYVDKAEPPAVESTRKCDREVGARRHDGNCCDDIDPNSSERSVSDVITQHRNGSILNIGTWNIRTLYKAGRLDNCLLELESNNLDILGLAEVRWTESGRIKKKGHVICYSGGEEHKNGVGMVINRKYASALQGYWPISDRVMMIKLTGNPFDMAIIQVYAPTSDHSENEIEDFYHQIGKALKHTKPTDIIMVMGDLNAKVGRDKISECMGQHGLGERNERGERLIEFSTENNLIIANTFYQHPNRKLYTWRSPGDLYRNQIDYIMINEKYRNGIQNIYTYPGADMNSDHCLLVCKIKVKLKIVKKKILREQQDLDQLKDEEFKTRYAVEVNNRFSSLNNEEKEQLEDREKLENKWNNFRDSILGATKELLPVKIRKKHKEWMTVEILQLMKERKELKDPDKSVSEEYKEKDRKITAACKKAKEDWCNDMCDEIEKLDKCHNSREMHQKIKQLTNKGKRLSNEQSCIKDKEGNILFEKQDINNRWTEYIRELYDDPNRQEYAETEADEGPAILREEVKFTIRKMKTRKAPGIDEITAEHLKALDEEGITTLTEICNEVYETGYIPEQLKHSLFIKIPKKAKAVDCTDYRTISLMSNVTKLILRIITNRNLNTFERETSDNQSGFRPGKGTREGIFNLRILLERCIAINKPIYICFIDYQKAFDRVLHGKLMEVLMKCDIDSKDRRIIQKLYWEQTASIKINEDEEGEKFNIRRGVRQGCVLSPALFNIYTEFIYKELTELPGIKVGGNIISNLRYADDTALLANSEEELQDLVRQVEEKSSEYGLTMNPKKTKVMVIKNNNKELENINIHIDGKKLEQVKKYLYLGHIITEDGRCDTEIRKRIEMSRNNFIKMKNLLTSKQLKMHSRIRLMKCYILSTFLYSAEVWTISNTMWNKIEAFEMWLLRRMMKISYTEHKTNEKVLEMAGYTRSLKENIIRKKNEYYGHLIRKGGLQTTLLEAQLEGKRYRGRPRRSWMTGINDSVHRSYVGCKRTAWNRDEFRWLIHQNKRHAS